MNGMNKLKTLSFCLPVCLGGEPDKTEDSLTSTTVSTQPMEETSHDETAECSVDPDKIGKKKRKMGGDTSKAEEAMNYALETLKKIESKPESQHAGFLKYLDECLREVSPNKIKSVKRKILNILHQAMEEEW